MRRTCCWRSIALSAAMLTGSSACFGQDFVPLANPEYAEAAPSAAVPANASSELRAILDRLDQQERELSALRGQLHERALPAKEASLAADSADGKKVDAGPLKKVDTITKPSATIFGRVVFDHVAFEDDPALVAATGVDRLNETGFSTTRIGAKGNVYENVLYNIEVEFEGTETDFKDVYAEVTNAPYLGIVRIGHFREPYSVEENTSNLFNTFMERSSARGAFVPSRNFGVMAYKYIAENDNWSWFAGTFRNDSPDNPTARASHIGDEGDWVFTGRVAGLLYYDEPSAGRYLVHVGGSYSARNDLTVVSFASRPELGSQAGYLSSTFTGDDDWDLYGLEAIVIWGPGSVQAEYYLAKPDSDDVNGGYVQASYFLTGENRGYRKDTKRLDRIKVIEDFFRVSTAEGICTGRGAWELKARYSWLDLNAGLAGTRGYQNGFTAGANWYWNPYTRMMFEYNHEDVDLLTGVQGANDNFGVRFQIDF